MCIEQVDHVNSVVTLCLYLLHICKNDQLAVLYIK